MSSEPNPVNVIDAREIPSEQRHPSIFKSFDALEIGGRLEVVNSHDPLPLHYQFQLERAGLFVWQYLERGPDLWRVRIERIA